jgi:hypothetical protein
MPSQLYNNGAVYFICARNFTYAGKDYSMGEEFPQDEATGRIDLLIRTRRLFAVVDDPADQPRHWHHHVWSREVIDAKLGTALGESAYNKPKQHDLTFPSVETTPAKKYEDQDVAAALKAEAHANALTEKVLDDENAEGSDDVLDGDDTVPGDESGDDPVAEETAALSGERQNVVSEGEDLEDDEPVITEEDLYDPTEHTVDEVMDYLASDISEEEYNRVVAVEQANKKRKGILDNV